MDFLAHLRPDAASTILASLPVNLSLTSDPPGNKHAQSNNHTVGTWKQTDRRLPQRSIGATNGAGPSKSPMPAQPKAANVLKTSDPAPTTKKAKSHAKTPPVKIICDPGIVVLPPHPLTELQQHVRGYLIRHLPSLVEAAVVRVQRQQQIEAEEDRKVSIHARPKRPPRVPIPDEEEWREWSPAESILWLDKVLPRSSKLPASASAKLIEFIRPHGEKGARKGEAWGRGECTVTFGRVCCPILAADHDRWPEQGIGTTSLPRSSVSSEKRWPMSSGRQWSRRS